MRSLRKILLERLVESRPRRALQLACRHFGICAVQLRLPPDSPLFQSGGGELVELPLDDVITPLVLEHGRWQTEELEFIGGHLGNERSVLLDIGANIGLITRQLIHRLPQLAAAVCFEPHPGNYKLLSRNLAHLPQCHLVAAALAAEEGELTFYEELGNVGNYSLNADAMRGKQFRTSTVRCLAVSEPALLAPVPEALRELPLVWKSDTQGFDELIMTSLPMSFWQRVRVGVMEMWRIERPSFDRERLAQILATYAVRRFGADPQRNLPVEEILAYSEGSDYGHQDLFFARQ